MNYIILIGIIYIIYKLNDVLKETNFMYENLHNTKINGSVVNKKQNDYNINSKSEVVNNLKSELTEDFVKNNDTLIEHIKEHIVNVEKAYDNPNSKETIVYHGGCLGCKSQKMNGIGACKGCQYFTANWGLPNLRV